MVSKLVKVFALSLLSAMAFDSNASAQSQLPPIKPGVPGKYRGEIIAPMLDEQIAAWCDFNKQIVVTHTNILCSYVGDKTAPAPSAKNRNQAPKKVARAVPKDLKPTLYEMNEYGTEQEA